MEYDEILPTFRELFTSASGMSDDPEAAGERRYVGPAELFVTLMAGRALATAPPDQGDATDRMWEGLQDVFRDVIERLDAIGAAVNAQAAAASSPSSGSRVLAGAKASNRSTKVRRAAVGREADEARLVLVEEWCARAPEAADPRLHVLELRNLVEEGLPGPTGRHRREIEQARAVLQQAMATEVRAMPRPTEGEPTLYDSLREVDVAWGVVNGWLTGRGGA
jgi:hypothetical protein